ncbi:hypothetical protein ACJMK2_011773 [Sinanodonta woodiana]|uniref:Uncharacterized protein n=1 Tax=Sinanodonta woodiana TaxID=1069815 RepID=A0ABD3V978_SINWO
MINNDVGVMETDFMTPDGFLVDLGQAKDVDLRNSQLNQWDRGGSSGPFQEFHPGHPNWGQTSGNTEEDRWWLNQKDVQREQIKGHEKRRNKRKDFRVSKQKDIKTVAISKKVEKINKKESKFQNNNHKDKQKIALKATAVGLLGLMLLG